MTRRDLVLAAFAVVLAGCTLLLDAGPHDEGLVLAAADRVADGQLPYRDFWWNYGPGQAYLLGGLTALAGPSLLGWRLVHLVLCAAVAVLAARLVDDDRQESRWGWLGGAAAAGAMAWPAIPGPGPMALALGLGALLVARDAGRPAMAGVLTGLAALWRPELGVAALLAVLLAGAPRARTTVAAAVTVVAGYLPFLLLAPGDLLDDTLGFLDIQDLQRLPFPFAVGEALPDPNKVLEAAFPALLVLGVAGTAAWAVLRGRSRRARPAWALLPLVVAGLSYLLARTDEFHLLPLALALVLVAGRIAVLDGSRGIRIACAAALGLVLAHGLERQAGRLLHSGDLVRLSGAPADGVRADPAFARGVAFVADAVRDIPGPVLVAPPSYRRVRFGAPLLNVLLQRANPSRYDVVQPGVVTTAEVQREIADDLRATRTPWVVRWIAPPARATEPNGGGRIDGSDLLDDVIARDYREVTRDASFVVLLRRDYDPPS